MSLLSDVLSYSNDLCVSVNLTGVLLNVYRWPDDGKSEMEDVYATWGVDL